MNTVSAGKADAHAHDVSPLERVVRVGSGRRASSASDRPVLIVDDVPDNLLALEGMLRREDVDILTASSGRDALEILLEREVAVAIVDVMMPEMDGFELAQLVRGVERTRRVPIIFVTAASKAEYRVFTGYQAGAIDFLFKTLDEHVLQAKVDVLVTLARQQKDLDRAREQAERAQRETEILLRLARATSQAQSPEEVYAPALDAVRDLLGADRSAILLFDESDRMRFQAWRGLSDICRAAVDGQSPWTREERNARPILIADVTADERMAAYRSICAAERISAVAFVPLTARGRLLGKFMVYWGEPRTYSAHDEGLVVAIAAQVSEALDRAKTQEALRLTEEKLRAALAAGHMGVWEWHIPTGHVVWSPELQAIHGLEPGTFEGTFEAYQRDVHPDDKAGLLRTVEETLASGRDHQIEYRIVRPDGQVRWVVGFGKVLSRADGAPALMTGVCFDITERKQAEQALRDSAERYRTLFEVSLYGVITIDENGVIETANPAAERTFGFSAAEMVGRNVTMLMPEPYRSEHSSYLGNYGRTRERKIIGIGREVVGQRKDGSQFPMDLAVSEFLVDGKRYFKGIVVDITERKRLEQAREAAIAELEQTLRYNEIFAGVLAHDLRNPLGQSSALHSSRLRNMGTVRPTRSWRRCAASPRAASA